MALRSRDTIINAALLRCGRDTSGGDVRLREACNANYDEIVRSAFEQSDGGLPFGRAYVQLTSRAVGSFGFDDAFTVPNDVLHIVEIYLDEVSASDRLVPWEFDASTQAVMVNADNRTLHLRYIREGQESTWSSDFALGVQRRLEAVIKDFLEETEEAIVKEQDADMKFLRAGVKGAKGRSSERVFKRRGGRLSRARFTEDRRGTDY